MPARYRGPDRLRTRGLPPPSGSSREAASDSLRALAITGIDEEI